MNPKIIEFIEQHINIIENKDFDLLYSYAVEELAFSGQSELTAALLSAGIDPLHEVDTTLTVEVPSFYLAYNTEVDKIEIPEGIKGLNYGAFASSHIKEIQLPSTLIRIGRSVFSGSKVRELYLPDNVNLIEDEAFRNLQLCEKISIPRNCKWIYAYVFQDTRCKVEYRGTKEELMDKEWSSKAFQYSYIDEIECLDGIIRIDNGYFEE